MSVPRGCYICRPDDPSASPEGCAACEQDWMEMAMHMLEDQAWMHETDCDCARRCNHLPDEACERCTDA